MAKKLVLKQAYEEVEIGDKTFRLSLADEDIKNYQKAGEKMQEKVSAVKTIEDSVAITKEALDVYFGPNSGQEIYEICGKSAYVLAGVLEQMVEIVREKVDEMKAERAAQYTGE